MGVGLAYISTESKIMSDQNRVYTAAALVIGNEILSGRTQDKNINYIAEKLGDNGVRLMEVRIVPDIESMVVHAVNRLRVQYDYVFTTGGIGPTHDDITAECMAKAFEVDLVQNEDAYKILLGYYKDPKALTEARLKMALMPEGAVLVDNPVSGAPGFRVENVYVMAGVPGIMQGMLDSILPTLKGGAVVLSESVELAFPESAIAEGLGVIQDRYFPDVEIGSYPQYREGKHAVSVVLRSVDAGKVKQAAADVQALSDSLVL
ncbi:molybdopterin-binding protein [Alphaproteobacteria bacterium]|nr:molybdopterin-binding protein [Alphaproteobacteria bacterium]